MAYLNYSRLIAKKSKDYDLQKMIVTASNKDELKPIAIKSCNIIVKVLKEDPISNRDAVRSRSFTQKITQKIRNYVHRRQA